MKIALVHDWLIGMHKEERDLEILCELYPQSTLFTLFLEKDSVSETIQDMPVITSSLQRYPWILSKFAYYMPLFPIMIEQFDFTGYDLVISSSHHVAKGIITQPDTLHICYCHAPMPVAWQEQDETGSKVQRLIRAALKPYLRLWDIVSSQRVDHFVTGSNATAAQILKYYRREAAVIDHNQDRTVFKQQMQAYIEDTMTEFNNKQKKEKQTFLQHNHQLRSASHHETESTHRTT